MKCISFTGRLVFVLTAVVAMIVLFGCNNGTGAALFGKWILESEVISDVRKAKYAGYEKLLKDNKTESMEFFNDGTGVYGGKGMSDGLNFSWKVVGKKRLAITASLLGTAGTEVCDYEISGSILIFTLDDGSRETYVKREKWEEYKKKKQEEIIRDIGRDIVSVKGGTFTMGCTVEQGDECDDDEKPTHNVTVGDFYIGKYEVTQKQWKAVMGENPSNFKGDDNLPVEKVSWNDVQKFIEKLKVMTGKKYRLPTEAEWEYAARGGSKSKGYKYSGSDTLGDVAWYGENSNEMTHTVGTKKPNELGIYDMSGNVWEWVNDWVGGYTSSAQTNPTGPSTGSYRVYRGGSWYFDAGFCRVSNRDFYYPGIGYYDMGFRLVLSP